MDFLLKIYRILSYISFMKDSSIVGAQNFVLHMVYEGQFRRKYTKHCLSSLLSLLRYIISLYANYQANKFVL